MNDLDTARAEAEAWAEANEGRVYNELKVNGCRCNPRIPRAQQLRTDQGEGGVTMYASKTPRALSHDPHPYVDQWGIDRNDDGDWAGYDFDARFHFDPRPEFDHVQHNEPNPILCGMREDVDEFTKDCGGAYSLSGHAKFWLRCLPDQEEQDLATPEQIDHARKVLTRLANLSQIGA